MKPEEVEQLLRCMVVKSPPPSLDRRIAETLRQDSRLRAGLRARLGFLLRNRFAAGVAVALAALGFLTIAHLSLRGLWKPSIALADVIRALNHDLKTHERIHLVITERKLFSDLDIDDYVGRREIWVQRPCYMCATSTFRISDAVTDDQRAWHRVVPTTTIYNESGTLSLRHDIQRWGIHEADAINLKHNVPHVELMNDSIDKYLRAHYYAKYNEHYSSQGEFVEYTEIDGEAATIYDFTGFEKSRNRCWLRNSDNRLLRMEVFSENAEEPETIYYPIEYDPEIPAEMFAHEIPEGYTNGQLLGFEEQPYEMNSQLVAVIHEAESAKIYALDIQPGQTREEAIAATVSKGEPQVHVYSGEHVDSEMNITGTEVGVKPDGSSLILRTIGGALVAGERTYGVRRNGGGSASNRLHMVDEVHFDGTGQVVFEYVMYGTNRMYCKLAYDADGDGVMDAWCEVPSKVPGD